MTTDGERGNKEMGLPMSDSGPKGQRGLVLFVGRDIFLGTMVSQAVQKAGFSSKAVTSAQVYNTVSEDLSVRAVVADLKEAKEYLSEIVEAGSAGSHPKLIAITFHTDLESKRQAQKAGFEHVIHRSQIASHLPQILVEKKL